MPGKVLKFQHQLKRIITYIMEGHTTIHEDKVTTILDLLLWLVLTITAIGICSWMIPLRKLNSYKFR